MKHAIYCEFDGEQGVLRNTPTLRVYQDIPSRVVVIHEGHTLYMAGLMRCLSVVFVQPDGEGAAVTSFSRS